MEFQIVVLLVGAIVLALGVTANALKRLWLTAPMLAVAAGAVLGPDVTGLLDPEVFEKPRVVLKDVAELTLAVSLTATALQFSRKDLRQNLVRGGLLVTLGMVGMFVVTSAGALLLLDLPFWAAVLVGAILTPTDPVVASTLVTGSQAENNLPRWLRRSLQLESGANDGLAIVLVLLPALVLAEAATAGEWFGEAAAEVGIGLGVGLATGLAAGKAVDATHRRGGFSEQYVLALGVGLALVNVAGATLLGGSGVLAAFVSALLFDELIHPDASEPLEQMQGAVEQLFILPVFALFGLLLPWDAWASLGIAGIAFGLWALFLRRPLVVAGVLAATDTGRRGTAFLSWFGPMGVAAMYYVTLVEEYRIAEYETIFAAVTLAVTFSVVAHSVTATPAVRRFAGRPATATLRSPVRGAPEERS